MPTRRQFLCTAAAASSLLLVGGAPREEASGLYTDWIGEVLREALPGHTFDPEGLRLYVKEYTAHKAKTRSLRLDFYALGEKFFDLHTLLPPPWRKSIVDEHRRILTGFLMGSDFFGSDPPPRTITYLGKDRACANPFAQV